MDEETKFWNALKELTFAVREHQHVLSRPTRKRRLRAIARKHARTMLRQAGIRTDDPFAKEQLSQIFGD